MTEQLALNQSVWDRATIDRNEWSIATRAQIVDGARSKLFTGSSLPLQKDRCLTARHAVYKT